MTGLINMFARYIPTLVVQRLAANPAPPTEPVSFTVPAAVLFADISGFTNLADRLAKRGPDGAEALSVILNDVFDELISLITVLGGDVVIFAGDALIALWPATDEDTTAAIRRAAQCSIALQTLFNDETLSDSVQFNVRMGISVGDVRLLQVGGIESRWFWLVTGQPLVEASKASYQAEDPGRVVLSSAAWQLVEDLYAGHVYESGAVRLDVLGSLQPMRDFNTLELYPAMEPALRAYIPRGVLARLEAGHNNWLGELRRLTVLFINLPGLYDTSTSLEHVQQVISTIQSILYRYEGNVNKLSVDEKGATLVAAFGMPPLAHEDDAVRGVQVALMIHAALHKRGVSCSVGVTTGQVFCGEVGNVQRREYTMLGTVVNLAAQLMQAAQGSIICDAVTYQAAQSRVSFDALPPLKLKGKSETIAVYRPQSQIAQNVRGQHSLVGRAFERFTLLSQLQALIFSILLPDTDDEATIGTDNRSSVIIIDGEAGMGKSQLVDDLRRQAADQGVRTLVGTGEALDHASSYHPWQAIICELLDIDATYDAASGYQHLLERLGPGLMPLSPLLNVVLPFDLPESEQTEQMSSQERAEATRDLLLRLLRDAATCAPLLLILEDAQWFDSSSWALVRDVGQQIDTLLLVLTTRPLNGAAPAEYYDLLQMPATSRLTLKSLSFRDTMALLCHRLAVPHVPEILVSLIREHTQGNPFFSEELLYWLRDAGLVHVVDGVCQVASEQKLLQALRSSDTVQAVITSRMDRLSLDEQMTLKVASVIGHVFTLGLLHAIHPVRPEISTLDADLTTLQQLDLIEQDSSTPEPTYQFKQIITRDVVYNLIAFAQRRQVHRAIAHWYQQTYPDRQDDFVSLLSYHFDKADDKRALTYFVRAGDLALTICAYQEAVLHYDGALAFMQRTSLDVHVTEHTSALLRHLFVQRGRALELGGQREQALENYYTMEALARQRGDQPLGLAALMARATSHMLPVQTDDPASVHDALQQALALAHKLHDLEAESKALWNLMLLHLSTGALQQAVAYGEQSLALARELDLHEQQAFALHDLATAYRAIGELDQSLTALEEAGALWRRLGNEPMQADNLARRSVSYFFAGNYRRAIAASEEVDWLEYALHNPAVRASSRFLVGNAYFESGMYGQAITKMQEALTIAEQSNNLGVLVGTRADLAWIYASLGDIDYGLELAHTAREKARSHIPHLEAWALAVLVRLSMLKGEWKEARELCSQIDYRPLLSGHSTATAPMLAALATGELALASRDFTRVLQVTDELYTHLTTHGIHAFRVHTLHLKSHALLALQQEEAARDLLQMARAKAESQGALHSLWHVVLALSSIEYQRGKTERAQSLWEEARTIVETLASAIDDPVLRASFLSTPYATTMLRKKPSPLNPHSFQSWLVVNGSP
jgi:class 3 adenylate cyclase/tetratricopeptide (TPR) repeat protein